MPNLDDLMARYEAYWASDEGKAWMAAHVADRARMETTGVCPRAPHRGPEGPNEDLAQCSVCLSPSYGRRPVGETFGEHAEDCSLPVDHASFCAGGGPGHPPSDTVRGYFPPRPRD